MFVAANSDFGPRPNAQLDAYLEWVSTYDGGDKVSPAPSAAAPAKKPAAPFRASESVDVELVEVAPVPQPPRRVREKAPPAARRQADPEEDEAPRPKPRRAEPEPPRKPRKDDRDEESEEEPARVMGMTMREVLMLAIGLLVVFGLAVVGVVVWLVLRLLS